MNKRVFLIVLDSFGIGPAPDAKNFGDENANTLLGVSKTGILHLPTMTSLGLGDIDGVTVLPSDSAPLATHARLLEKSLGKDTTTGHWEMMGLISHAPMPTYPNGFPKEVLEEFERKTGYGVICNLPYSGTDVIRDYGEEHLRTGKLIVYTSADSVFQIAAHEELVSIEELYRICEIARSILQGEHAVGRVIARPFVGTAEGGFTRTANRRDFSLVPPQKTILNRLSEKGYDVIGVGKIGDIFVMSGLTETHPTHGNTEGMSVAKELAFRDFNGLCFINLVDFDMLYGHRQDAVGYANALNEFDAWLKDFLPLLGKDDLLLITADHGCDPTDESTDHTREAVPYLQYQIDKDACNLGTLTGFDHVGKAAYQFLTNEEAVW
ncbi:MAG: phosphopentomutase [Clostridia bacterium]|nr:phosphopentomutase [Clostridia bacterium]